MSAVPRRRWSTLVARLLAAALVFVVVLVLLFGGGAILYAQNTLPLTSGDLTVPGLQRPASVARDRYGVPHISAYTLHDVAFAQGYVTAQDRLFQMEVNRRIAQGRLAEMFGAGPDNSILDADEYLRTLGLYRAAQIELVALDPAVHTELDAYAQGVNAFIQSHPNNLVPTGNLPLEFAILRFTPQPWTAVDSLAYGRTVALSLDNNWQTKLARAAMIDRVGPDVTSALFPSYPTANPTLLTYTGAPGALVAGRDNTPPGVTFAPSGPVALAGPAAAPAHASTPRLSPALARGAALVQSLLGDVTSALGSNDWVVDGSLTVSGKPLLANDPHLGIAMPATWYEVALRGGGLDVVGFSFPGVPGVVIGHNNRIAWGVTNVGADDTDLYLETLDPSGHPGQYKSDGQWLPLITRQETIQVRGAAPVTITVRSTRHGPLLNDVVTDLKGTPPVALQWTALQPIYSFQGFFRLDFAQSWSDFLAAVSQISISQNFVYADVDGNIGYRMSGLLPLRPSANDLVPVDGSTSANDWQGYVPQSQMPMLFNPPTHMIVTANNQIVPDDASIYVTANWDQGYRARRITDLLLAANARLTPADFQHIQADMYSVPAAQLTPYFIAAGQAAGGDAAAAAALLRGWDYNMARDSVAASVYEVTAGTLIREAVLPLLGATVYDRYRSSYSSSGLYSLLIGELAAPAAPFFGLTTSTANPATARDTAIAHALAGAMTQLRATFGDATSIWRWGALHRADFAHPLAGVAPLDRVFGLSPVERPGDTTTVSVGGDGGFSSATPSYDQRTVSSMREIIDLSNLDASLWIITVGESGEPYSAHYADLLPLWDANQYQRMDYSPAAVGRAATDILVLKP
jgi:penicillin amidase